MKLYFAGIACAAVVFATVIGARRPVVLLGDSIIAKGDWSGVAGSIVNRAVSGAPTKDIATQAVPLTARAVLLEGGINDLGNGSDDQILPNYQRIVASFPFLAKRYLIGILPVDEAKLDPSWKAVVSNAKIAALNARIADLCKDCIVINVNLPADGYLPDGIHLNAIGYSALKQSVVSSLK